MKMFHVEHFHRTTVGGWIPFSAPLARKRSFVAERIIEQKKSPCNNKIAWRTLLPLGD
ncbi:hypothetical protein HMPREF7215_2012 [Pyramidobacter piscolens W5455]|uniref:Uncharacterized protein n=2 Tax=Pyramidobacter piscolens TaxID=638849 RepID=A0ABM9ZRK6_9BACT|nr:hypothetical protein HMPREF7215_2012 [Pyramidobacter piscolens W5455]